MAFGFGLSLTSEAFTAGGASLNLPLAGATALDSRVTFTRASTATYTGSDGLLKTAAVDVPRLVYDPATLAAQGLLVEEQRTNLLLYSEQFDNVWWTKTRSSITANATNAPTGTLVADKLVEDTTASASHPLISTTVTLTGTTVHSFSVFAKAAERTAIVLRINAGADGIWGSFNLSTGAVGTVLNSGTGSGATLNIQSVGNSWYCCTLTGIFSASSTTPAAIIYPAVSTTDPAGTSIVYTGNGVSGIYIYGAQLEAGAFATSYIPTTTAQATRAADVATMTGTNFSSWYNQSEGTIVTEWACPSAAAFTSNKEAVSISDNTYNNFISLGNASGGNMVGQLYVAGVSSLYDATAVNLTSNKAAIAYVTLSKAYVANGVLKQSNLGAGVPTVTQLGIGNPANGGAGKLCGTIKSITYYPRRLSNTELVSLTS